jgi:phosphate transport system permease protein
VKRVIYLFSILGVLSVACLSIAIVGGLLYSAARIDLGGVLSAFSLSWNPPQGEYGVIPMIFGTLSAAVLATIIAIPLSFGIIISIWASNCSFMRWILRFMTGIPTVVYSFCGLFILVPICRTLFVGSGYNILSVAAVLSILILPTMTIIADSALYPLLNKPETLRLTAESLGLNREKTLLHIALYIKRKWLLTGVLLSFSRALGDTIIALMISGNTPVMPDGLFSTMRTLSAHISLLTASEITPQIEFTMFLAGFLLFSAALAVSLLAKRLRGE